MAAIPLRCTLLFAALVPALLLPAISEAQLADASRVDDALGRNVRISHADGSRTTGTLVALSSTEVVIRENNIERRVGLADVDRVERVRHPARNGAIWAAAVAGGTAAALSPLFESDGAADTAGFIAAWAGAAGGAGAGIGAAIGAANRDENVLYRRPRRAAFVIVAPVLSVGTAGFRLSVAW